MRSCIDRLGIAFRLALLGLLVCLMFVGSIGAQGSLQAKEFRAAWVASVLNIDFPKKAAYAPEQQQDEIAAICETAQRVGLNALLVQVRPECDALYRSQLEPWSRFLTGTQGRDPGYDPLKIFLEEGRKRGIAIHAWINPYRAAFKASDPCTSLHCSQRMPQCVRKIGQHLWLDPAEPEVQQQVLRVVADLLTRYPLAGIHLDDYFYPYPDTYSGNFPDSAGYQRYCHQGGRLSLGDWRRTQVNTLVKNLHTEIKRIRPQAQFGISPFGIYTKGSPATVRAGLDQYHQLYADPVLWLKQGWVDYLAPQLYWKDGGAQSFSALLKWWRDPQINPHHLPIYPGIAIEHLAEPPLWPVQEFAKQLQLEKTIGPRLQGGFILWNFSPLQQNIQGIQGVVASH